MHKFSSSSVYGFYVCLSNLMFEGMDTASSITRGPANDQDAPQDHPFMQTDTAELWVVGPDPCLLSKPRLFDIKSETTSALSPSRRNHLLLIVPSHTP